MPLHHISGITIRLEKYPTPIPARGWDWMAYLAGDMAEPFYGFGSTEEEAIEDLREQIDDEKIAAKAAHSQFGVGA